MKTFQRSFCRARLPVKYSEGFNPHICMSILSPLPTGFRSEYELCDVELTTDGMPDNAAERLQEALPSGIVIKDVYEPASKAADMAASVYELITEGGDAEKIANAFLDPLMTVKKSKRGERTVDVRDYVIAVSFEARGDHTACFCTLKMGEDQINPSHIVKALRERGLIPEDGAFVCTRTAILDKNNELFK